MYKRSRIEPVPLAYLQLLETQPATCELDLSDRHIGDEGLDSILKSLRNSPNQAKHLDLLDMSHNSLTANGVKLISELIQEGWTINVLNLSCNSLWNIDALARTSVLRSLQELDVSSNHLDDLACKTFANGILTKANSGESSLGKLIMAQNSISDSGVLHLVEAFRYNETIHTISLANNRIGDDGIVAIADMLKDNKPIHSLDLSGNSFSLDVVSIFAPAIKAHSNLVSLKLGGNLVGEFDYKESQAQLTLLQSLVSDNRYARYTDAKVAFAMGFHPRIGIHSSIRSLVAKTGELLCNDDLLTQVWDFAFDYGR